MIVQESCVCGAGVDDGDSGKGHHHSLQESCQDVNSVCTRIRDVHQGETCRSLQSRTTLHQVQNQTRMCQASVVIEVMGDHWEGSCLGRQGAHERLPTHTHIAVACWGRVG